RVEAPGHVDVAEHLEIPRGAPARLVDLGDVAAGDCTGIVDENVGVRALRCERVDVLAVAEIERVVPHRHIVFTGDLGAHGFETGLGAGHQHHVAALLGQHLGAGTPDTFRGSRYQRLAPAQPEFHRSPPA